MALSEEETKQIKEQLLGQLSNFPEDKQAQIKKQVEEMTAPQVEAFVKENRLNHMGNQCIFCSIVAGKSPSFKIAENPENIAILEINPLSKGHTLIVPKEHLDKTSDSTNRLAQDIKERLESKFSPNNVQINELKIMDHALLEVIPIFGGEKERSQASEEELKALQEEILKPLEEIRPKPEIHDAKNEIEEAEEDVYKMPSRIP